MIKIGISERKQGQQTFASGDLHVILHTRGVSMWAGGNVECIARPWGKHRRRNRAVGDVRRNLPAVASWIGADAETIILAPAATTALWAKTA